MDKIIAKRPLFSDPHIKQKELFPVGDSLDLGREREPSLRREIHLSLRCGDPVVAHGSGGHGLLQYLVRDVLVEVELHACSAAAAAPSPPVEREEVRWKRRHRRRRQPIGDGELPCFDEEYPGLGVVEVDALRARTTAAAPQRGGSRDEQ